MLAEARREFNRRLGKVENHNDIVLMPANKIAWQVFNDVQSFIFYDGINFVLDFKSVYEELETYKLNTEEKSWQIKKISLIARIVNEIQRKKIREKQQQNHG